MKTTAIWQDGELLSAQRQPLYRDSDHSFSDGVVRYPVIAEIPYLRAGRDELRQRVLRLLDDGDELQARCELLRDQDAWATTPAPKAADLRQVACRQVSLRSAMQQLQWGPVSNYFAYRWSDPTYLSGLALLDLSVERGSRVFELACGIGHYCQELCSREVDVTGADVVFAKLYLARHYTCPQARLICLDAASSFPLRDEVADTVFCHDAFYFLRNKAHVASEMRRLAGSAGTVAIGHTHNADTDNFSAGEALSVEGYRSLFPNAVFFDDDELTRAVIEARNPGRLDGAQRPAAVSLVEGRWSTVPAEVFSMPVSDARLRVNPLFEKNSSGGLDRQSPRFPSERYEREYGPASSYLELQQEVGNDEVARAENGNWSGSPHLSELVRRRIFVSLPERW